MSTSARIKQSQYNTIVVDYITKQEGCFVLISDDLIFYKNLVATLRYLSLDHHLIQRFTTLNKAISQSKNLLNQFKHLTFFIEAYIHGRSNILQFNMIKSLLKEQIKILCLTNEIERQYVIQMFEMGADNVIIKPISINSLIQKIATTINPGSSWSKKVDECKELIEKNNLSDAEKIVDYFLSQKPDSAIALILKGDIDLKRKNFAQAEFYYQQANIKNPMYLEPLKKLAMLYDIMNNYEKKLEILKKMDALSSVNHQRKIEIGHTYLKLDQEDKGKEYFQEAVKQVQKQAKDMLSAAYMEIAQKVKDERPDLCSQYIAKAIDAKGSYLSRKDLWMFNEIGISLRRENKWEEAIRYYKRALDIAPMEAGLYYNIGMAYAQGKNFYKAVEFFQKALEIKPEIIKESPSISYNIARAYTEIEHFPEAMKFLNKSLELDPEYEPARKLKDRISG